MEASGAGLASADGQVASGEGQEGQQEGQSGAGSGDAAIAQLAQQMEGLSSGQDELRQFLSGIAQQQEAPAQEEAPAPPDMSFLDNPDPQQAAVALQELMRTEAGTEAQRLMQEQLAPLQEQVSDMRRQQETDALVAEYPDLGKPEVAEKVVAAAHQLAALVGQPELAANTQFVRLAYMAGRAAELAQKQNGAAEGTAATLEGAGGASPGGAGQGATSQEALAQSWGRGNNVLSKL